MKIIKNPKVNLENKRKIFLEIGFISALLITLLAFECRSYEKHTIVLYEKEVFIIEEIEIPITKDKIEKQKPPPPVYREITVTEDPDLIDDSDFPEIEFGDEVYKDWVPSPTPQDELPDDIPVRFSSDKAKFPGGDQAMYSYFADNIVYPAPARELGVQGKVYIDFVIEKDGTISNVVVLKGIGFGCDEEAVRVIKSMPRWEPAKQNHHRVRMIMTIPLKFTLR